MSFNGAIPDLILSGDSKNFKNWQATYLAPTTCQECRENHGKIFPFDVVVSDYIPVHENGRCKILPMRTKEVGTSSDRGFDGADAWVMYRGKLPDYYITKEEAKALGWKPKQANLAEVAPGKMLGGNIYQNKEKLLPSKSGRSWYQADLDFDFGFRNDKRLFYSNDGLIFVSYDHAQTFYEIIK
jgi:hypothetical protein